MKFLMIRVGKEIKLLDLDDIDWIKAEGKYSRIYTGERSYLKRQSLNSIEACLDQERFVRVSRGVIVNMGRIKKIQRTANYEYQIILDNDELLPWSRAYRQNMLDHVVA